MQFCVAKLYFYVESINSSHTSHACSIHSICPTQGPPRRSEQELETAQKWPKHRLIDHLMGQLRTSLALLIALRAKNVSHFTKIGQ